MAANRKNLLTPVSMDVLADKGYHTGEELQRCEESGITTFVSPKATAAKDSGAFPVTDFVYLQTGRLLLLSGRGNHVDKRNMAQLLGTRENTCFQISQIHHNSL